MDGLVVTKDLGGGSEKFTKIKFEKGLTKKSSPQIKTELSREKAIKNLEANGFVKKSFEAQNGGTGYVLVMEMGKFIEHYPNATSGAGDTLQEINNCKNHIQD